MASEGGRPTPGVGMGRHVLARGSDLLLEIPVPGDQDRGLQAAGGPCPLLRPQGLEIVRLLEIPSVQVA